MREEAGELCQTLEANEGQERAASEMADLLYHAMVLLNVQVGVECQAILVADGDGGACAVLLCCNGHADVACPCCRPRMLRRSAQPDVHAAADQPCSMLCFLLAAGCCSPPQGVPMEDVLRVLRQRFGTSGIAEKAARPPKQA